MANTRSALKAHRVSERRRERNRAVRSALRTYVKKARTGIVQSPGDAVELVKEAVKRLDKAASKGIIHKNQAARRKSRLMRQLARAQQAGAGGAIAAAAESRGAGSGRATSRRTGSAPTARTRRTTSGA